MSQQFLLPCSCGQKTVVSPAQAGGQVACSCGKVLAVPTLRGLRDLEIATVAVPSKPVAGWSPIHGAIFAAGLVIAAIGLVVLAQHGLQYSQIKGFRLTKDFTPDVERAEFARIDSLTPLKLLEEWHENIEHGLGEQEEPPWSRFQRVADHNLSRIKLGAAALAVGLIVSLITIACAPKSQRAAH